MATLIQTQIISQPFPRAPLPAPATTTTTAAPAPFVLPPSPLDASIAELAHLASQHHTSEYNRLKFGLQGCPIRYLPLSKHLPDFFLQLQQRQAQCAEAKSWWPSCNTPAPSASPVILGSAGALPQDTRLQREIEAAIAEPLDSRPRHPTPETANHTIKTSSTHPINISAIIPHELIPLLSSHLLFNSVSPSPPTMFEIPSSFSLDRLVAPSSAHPQPTQIHTTSSPPLPPQTMEKTLRTRTKVTEELQVALNGNLSGVIPLPKPEKRRSHRHTIPQRSAPVAIIPSEKAPVMLHSNASSVSLFPSPDAQPPSLHHILKPGLEPPSSKTIQNTIPHSPETSLLIGNIFLSSCPGKKVRLEGPVKGRSGVCRDLDTDLKRMKELGVGCIICCLDDGELEFLGAPWPEYEALAGANGIDVLRIPIPEGLAPLSPACLDAQLTKIINSYTLHGIPVLVHCRGGVGRAGVIACCWLIRLGLCGDKSTNTAPADGYTGN
ncbi:hypothetical protein DXG03_003894 [Asterophora parasitica]|uniref:Tyrosine specific protein phosphatases domain-containing protein n=1 Tax=Asterophora parasitica TaxID=117018 RepID=A0A9P7GFP7_9AGAR|nr:hypothetical protein DXG03_003894 [Asterophora parasitica]